MNHKTIISSLILIISFLISSSSPASDDAPILTLDTGGHMAMIRKIIPMRDGRHIISASDDKTIRIFDIETGKETQKILGQIGDGGEGKIFAIALTPDEKWLAVGGYLAGSSNEDRSAIRIYNLESGMLSRVLKSHSDKVFDLFVSSDGRYLVSGSADKTIKVWDIIDNFSLVKTFTGHSSEVFAVMIFKEDGNYKIVSTGDDNKVRLWSLDTEQNSYTHTDKLRYLAINDKYIAACGFGNKIIIFDHNLNKIKDITSETIPKGLSFSPDGRLLLAGTSQEPRACNIYDNLNGFKNITSFTKQDFGVIAVTFLDNHTALTGGGANNNIYIWDAYTGALKKKITGHGTPIWSIGIKGNDVAFGNIARKYHFRHIYLSEPILEKTINLNTFLISNLTKRFKKIDTNYQHYSLTNMAGGQFGYMDAVLVITQNGSETKITRDETNGYRHICYGFTQDGSIISGGMNGFLTAYNTQGQKTASFIGHTGQIWSIAIDGDTLVSGSSDQTIKLWSIKELKEHKKKIYPFLSIFISDDNEWAAWTEEGFYNASPNGDKYIGWHVNKGLSQAAEYYSAKQFRRFLYRPDIIQKAIELGSSKAALEEIAKIEPSIRDITLSELVKRAPVDVKIAEVNITKDNKAEVSVRLGSNNTTAPERITLFVNGAQQLKEAERSLKGAKPGDTLKYLITLPDRNNTVKVTIENQWAENSNEVVIDNPNGNDLLSQSTLYVAAIGISNYPNLPPQNQLTSPPIDAKSIAEHLQRLEGKLYKKVDIKILTDDKSSLISKANVENALIEQTQKANPLDTTIIFLAGHGVTDSKGSYHFITADTNIPEVFKEGINPSSLDWKTLHSILDKTMGRRVVIVDTCQAGGVFSENNTDIKRLVKDIHDVNSIVYSGTSRQDRGKETSKGGVFTLSIISGFEGGASYDGKILPFLRLRDFVDKQVPKLNHDIMLGLFRAVKIKASETHPKKTEEEVIDSVQRPVAVVPDGMEGFIIYAK